MPLCFRVCGKIICSMLALNLHVSSEQAVSLHQACQPSARHALHFMPWSRKSLAAGTFLYMWAQFQTAPTFQAEMAAFAVWCTAVGSVLAPSTPVTVSVLTCVRCLCTSQMVCIATVKLLQPVLSCLLQGPKEESAAVPACDTAKRRCTHQPSCLCL